MLSIRIFQIYSHSALFAVFSCLHGHSAYLRDILIQIKYLVSTALVLDRCATGVLHTLEDPKISKATLVFPTLDNPYKLVRPDKIKNKLLD